ncbi:LytTR family transcriptional regulator DNA-binding domain-containing protein [Dyadobacter sp. 3J3]|uniref:LytTR family transcriptional regulator DNA-binding domain-containing protein n=1 Tax=Dyadobacter sp. 3J3 TaxID=2606600 RepID=UPI001356CD79|nr:LytTR family transcriptional regulator DNA-binding domain-containing protein [Dyadobacter sp. 3J3]
MLQKLPEQEFVRVHRSIIVPFSRIENVRHKMINLAGEEIPIGSSYEESFGKWFKS